jgi:hypothetical protein
LPLGRLVGIVTGLIAAMEQDGVSGQRAKLCRIPSGRDYLAKRGK